MKYIIYILFLGVMLFNWQCTSSQTHIVDTTIYVSNTGNDLTGKGTSTKPYLTLNKAIDDVYSYIDNCKVKIKIDSGQYDIGSNYFLKKSEVKLINKGFLITEGNYKIFDTILLTQDIGNPFYYTFLDTVNIDRFKGMLCSWGGVFYPISENIANGLYLSADISFNNTSVVIYQNTTNLNLVGSSAIKAIINVGDGNKEFRHINLVGTDKKFFLQKESPFGLLYVYHSNFELKRLSAAGIYFKRTRLRGYNSSRMIDAENCVFQFSILDGTTCTSVLRSDFNSLLHTSLIICGGVHGIETTNLFSAIRIRTGTDILFKDLTNVSLPETGYIAWGKVGKIYLDNIDYFFDGSLVVGSLNSVVDSVNIVGVPTIDWINNSPGYYVNTNKQVSLYVEGVHIIP